MTSYNDTLRYDGTYAPVLPANSITTPYNGSTNRAFLPEGGEDYVPATYTYTSATTVWTPKDATQQGAYFLRCVPSVSFATVQVTGNSTTQQRHIRQFGIVAGKVTQANLGMTKAPAYADVIADGVQYKIQINSLVAVTLPGNVAYLLSLSQYTWTPS